MGKNSKRSKSYYVQYPKKFKSNHNRIASHMSGFLCSCNSFEKICLNEAYNILNDVHTKMYGNEQVELGTDTGDVSKNDFDDEFDLELKEEIETLKKQSKNKKHKLFQQIDTGCKNQIFVKYNSVNDPVCVSLSLMDGILAEKKLRTSKLIRMLPIQTVCRAFRDDLTKAVRLLISEKMFASTDDNSEKDSVTNINSGNEGNKGGQNSQAASSLSTKIDDSIKNLDSQASTSVVKSDSSLEENVIKSNAFCSTGVIQSMITSATENNSVRIESNSSNTNKTTLEMCDRDSRPDTMEPEEKGTISTNSSLKETNDVISEITNTQSISFDTNTVSTSGNVKVTNISTKPSEGILTLTDVHEKSSESLSVMTDVSKKIPQEISATTDVSTKSTETIPVMSDVGKKNSVATAINKENSNSNPTSFKAVANVSPDKNKLQTLSLSTSSELYSFYRNCKTFCVVMKLSNNKFIKRIPLSQYISEVVCELRPDLEVEYRSPDCVLLVEVLKNKCCLSLLPYYCTKYRKYNLLELLSPSMS